MKYFKLSKGKNGKKRLRLEQRMQKGVIKLNLPLDSTMTIIIDKQRRV